MMGQLYEKVWLELELDLKHISFHKIVQLAEC